jgi:sugar lactone lactonase YvrE
MPTSNQFSGRAVVLAALFLFLSFLECGGFGTALVVFSVSERLADTEEASLPKDYQSYAKAVALQIKLLFPNGLALDGKGNLYISDIGTHRILKLEKGRLTVIAGTGEGAYGGDGGLAVKAQLFAPHDLLFDAEGNLLIADTQNHRIRRIDRRGVITTVAGDGTASKASLNNPQSIALDHEGNLLVADTYNHVVRRIDRGGAMTTFAGSQAGFDGDGGPATKAQMSLPMAVTVAPDGSVYVSDGGNSRIRRIAPDGKIQTIAGFGPAQDTYGGGFAGDGGSPEKAKIFVACDLKADATGNLFISDSGNNRIRVIRGGVINTIAGLGQVGFSGDRGEALKAELNTPQKIAVAKDGSIFIADRANHRVRKVDANGLIRTIAGDGKPQE